MENARIARFAPGGKFDFIRPATESRIAENFCELHGPPSGLAGGSRIAMPESTLEAMAGHFVRLRGCFHFRFLGEGFFAGVRAEICFSSSRWC